MLVEQNCPNVFRSLYKATESLKGIILHKQDLEKIDPWAPFSPFKYMDRRMGWGKIFCNYR